ncbi:MAG: NAD-dependent epimerase/dehydratase family protein [Deltaproteobacteria bacterium]|nr:NAD-dependent epimerase/dehydratase family protein [Deltaproteobacteria bacterium]
MSIFLTGATGFLGKNLLRRLLNDGERVSVLVRGASRLGVRHENLTVHEGDLEDRDAVAGAMRGATQVYHVAAAVKEWVKDWSVFDRVNVAAYEQLLNIAADEGALRIVHTSSFMALGHSDGPGIGDETMPRDPDHFHNPYERTKFLAQQIDEKFIQRGAPIVVVQPGVIFGPGEVTEGNIVVVMLRDMATGKFPGIPGHGGQRWCYSFVDDVVEGHLLAMSKGRVGESYVLGGDNVTLDELVDLASKHLGRKVPRRHLPLGLLRVSARMMEWGARLTGKPPMLTAGKVGVLEHNWAYSSEKAVRELGYRPTPFPKALGKRWRGCVPRA